MGRPSSTETLIPSFLRTTAGIMYNRTKCCTFCSIVVEKPGAIKALTMCKSTNVRTEEEVFDEVESEISEEREFCEEIEGVNRFTLRSRDFID